MIRLLILLSYIVFVPVISAFSLAEQASLGNAKLHSNRFVESHARFLQRAQKSPVDLLFLGDSITARWSEAGKHVWAEHYAQYNSAHFGIGGDQAENVLWRVAHGELDIIRPKVIVLLVGTNDSRLNSAKKTLHYIENIIKQIQLKSPESKIILMAVFPRGPRTWRGSFDDAVNRMQMITSLNQHLAKLNDGKRVHFIDIGEQFIKNGKIPNELMPDQLHLSESGYKIWAKAIEPLLSKMMQDKSHN